MNYLLFLQNLREVTGGVFNAFMLEITSMAEAQITFLFFALVYWCINKRVGQYMGFNVAAACTLNQFLKAVCKVERPWVRDGRIHPVDEALPAAAGYSFPSGHAARTIAVWGTAGACTWKEKRYRVIGTVCWVPVALVLFSRNYLGVHTFADVAASFVFGMIILFLLKELLDWGEKAANRDILICIVGCILCFLPMLKIGCMTNSGAGMGILLGWLIERHFIQFETKGSLAEKVLRFAIGAVFIVGILQVIKPVLTLFMNAKYAGFFSMFILTFFIMAIYPYLFTAFYKRKKAIIAVITITVIVLLFLIVWKVSDTKEDAASEVEVSSEVTVTEVKQAEEEQAADSKEIDTAQAESAQMEQVKEEEQQMLVIGHRGYNSMFPENTLASFSGAIDIGVDYIETDVQMTRDGRIVLFHDDNLMRVAGVEGKIADYTYEELQQMDVGSWFNMAYADARIPSLEDFFALVKPSNCKIYLELKDIGEVEGFEQKVLEIAEQSGMEERCVFASFQYQYLVKLKSLDSSVTILYNTNSTKTTLPEEYPAEYYGLNADTVTTETVSAIHQAGAQAFVWTADTPTQMLNLKTMGVDGVVTNRPGLAKVLVREEYSYLAENYESSITMPGLYERDLPEMSQDMVVQGFTQAESLLVISAYSFSGTYNSILYIMDLNGKLQKTVDLCFKAHTGGIAYDELHNLLWVTGEAGKVYALSWTEIMANQYDGTYQVSFDPGLTNQSGAKVASFLCLDQGQLYVGSYVDGANGILNRYDITDINAPKLLQSVTIPERIQGLTFQTDAVNGRRYMYMSQGYQMEDAYLLKFIWDEQAVSYEKPLEKHVLPEGSEQILMTAKGLYILFESSARPYRATARIPNDQIYVIRTNEELNEKK